MRTLIRHCGGVARWVVVGGLSWKKRGEKIYRGHFTELPFAIKFQSYIFGATFWFNDLIANSRIYFFLLVLMTSAFGANFWNYVLEQFSQKYFLELLLEGTFKATISEMHFGARFWNYFWVYKFLNTFKNYFCFKNSMPLYAFTHIQKQCRQSLQGSLTLLAVIVI